MDLPESDPTPKKGDPGGYFREQLIVQWVAMAFGLLAAALWLTHSLLFERDSLTRGERDRLLTQANVIDRNLERQFGALDEVLHLLVAEFSTESHYVEKRNRNRYLGDLAAAMPGIRTILVLDDKGVVINCSRPELVGRSFAEREYFKRPMSGSTPPRLYMSPPIRSVQGFFVMPVSRIIRTPEGKALGVAVIGLEVEFFRTLLASVLYAEGMSSSLIHGQGVLYTTAPAGQGEDGAELSQPGTFFSMHRESGREESNFSGEARGYSGERMVALRTVIAPHGGPESQLVVTVSRELDSLYAKWRRDLANELGLFLAFALALCGGLYHHQTRQRASRNEGLAAARAIRALSEEFDRFFALSPDLFCISDEEGRFRRVNGAWKRLLGYSPEELVGKPFLDFVHPDDVEKTLLVDGLLRKGEPLRDFVNRYRAKDGSWHYIEWHSTEYRDGVAYAVARDVTEKILAQEEREKLLTELTNALAEVKTLAGLLPICSSCKKIRDDRGYWNQIEQYITEHSDAQFTHGICPDCIKKLYPEFAKDE